MMVFTSDWRRPLRAPRLWVCFLFLWALPAVVYWPNIWERFGFRDDYSMLRESHTEPGKVRHFSGGQARPVYGWLIEVSMQGIRTIREFGQLRLLSAFWIGLAAGGTFLCLVAFFDWSLPRATLFAGLLVCLPGPQVSMHWAIIWPHTVELALTVAAFWIGNLGIAAAHGVGRWAARICAGAVLAVAAWTYQPHTLFYLVLTAAGLLSRRSSPLPERLIWVGKHAVIVASALACAFIAIQCAYATGALVKGPRVAFESAPIEKLVWFVREPFWNALGLFVIDDDQGRSAPWHGWAASLTALVIAAGAVGDGVRRGWRAAGEWMLLFAAFAVAAYGINLLVAERWPTYRTLFSVEAVVLLFAVTAISDLLKRAKEQTRFGRRAAMAGVFVSVGLMGLVARWQTREFFVLPQKAELAAVETQARKLSLERPQHYYVIFPNGERTGTPVTYLDEFGARSIDSYWTPVEMIRVLLDEWSEGALNFGMAYGFDSSPEAPRQERFDVLIDLRGAAVAAARVGEKRDEGR